MPQQVPLGQCPLARAFVPFQCYVNRLPPLQGLKAGTIFPELVSPYLPRASVRGEQDGSRPVR